VTPLAVGFLIAASVLAVADWYAVARQDARLEYPTKPAVMVALAVVALALETDLDARRIAVVVALAFSLAGDVFLMLRRTRVSSGAMTYVEKGYFVPGLASFLIAHLAYIVGFQIEGGPVWLAVLLFVAVRMATLPITVKLIGALRANDQVELTAPVRAYAIAISGMVAAAGATGDPVAIVGAILFLFSDFLIAWSRFVTPLTWAPLAIIVTYHLGQTALVLSLL
jgi:uncharacterized membrane protein YhhN